MYHYNLIIIGSGSGGFAAASSAQASGLRKILLIEKRRIGYSLCTNEGCMPSKVLLASAGVKDVIEHAGEFGIRAGKPQVLWKKVQERVRRLVEKDFFSARREMIKQSGIEIVKGVARFLDSHTIAVGRKKIRGEKIIIATGSEVVIPPIQGLKETGFIDSDRALYLDTLPKSLIIIGGGYIAVELGTLFSTMGVSVTIIDRGDGILKRIDGDVAGALQKLLQKSGVTILLNAQIESVRRVGKDKVVAIAKGGKRRGVSADEILIAAGRKPTIGGLGVENTGVSVSVEGAIDVNEYMQTSISHIYAVGDANGKFPLVYAASMEGNIAGTHAAVGKASKMRYDLIASIIFSRPEIGTVGLTEVEAQGSGLQTISATIPMSGIGKAVAIGKTEGFIKLIAEKPSGKILGVHILGAQATDIIQVALPHLYHNDTVFDVINIPYPHPTLGEALSYPAEEIVKKLESG